MNEIDWDALCSQAHALSATVIEELVDRNTQIGNLKAALEDTLDEIVFLSKRVAELEDGIGPFAKLEAQVTLADDAWVAHYVRLGDVRRARALLGMDAAPEGEGGK